MNDAKKITNTRVSHFTRFALILTYCASSLAVSCDGSSSSDEGSLPLGETPPAPSAECSSPPTPISSAIEAQIAATQEAAAQARTELLDTETITVVTCGTGSPVPPRARAQSCTAVFVNGQFLLFDAGDGAVVSMENLNLPLRDLSALFLTHYHSDHVADVGEVVSRSWILGRRSPLPIYGGEAIGRVVDGFNRIYALDYNYRTAHHGDVIFPPDTTGAEAKLILEPGPDGSIVYEENGVTVSAYTVDHSPVLPALGYRVEYGGKAVAITGDTIDTEGLRNMSQGVDVLVSDVMNKSYVEDAECALRRLGDESNATIIKDIRSYHIDVEELATLAEGAGVGTLVLTHQVPALDDPGQIALVFGAPTSAIYSGELIVAVDGTRVTVPVE
ncbi:MAG TPA: MBL fold metallo-hydrolase [Polyangiales bacterium]|nr:MBL fold metallo-hydrolase [Polyangiales bacterium]